jgi:exodeoxyribonuclease-3
MRIMTWNVNSVRLRLAGLERIMADVQPDVICLQEIKAEEAQFPFDAVRAMGLEHIEVQGFKGYHGVATLSRQPLERLESREWCGKLDGRHVGVALPNGTEVHNFYVPAGGDEPDVEINDKFRHKMDFLAEMTEWGAARAKSGQDAILVGDLNIAPLATDVWSHKQLLKVVSHTPIETEAMETMRQAGQWTDLVRQAIPEDTTLYSWWSYRSRDWSTANKGRRLDHIWGTGGIVGKLKSAEVLRDARGWEKPSDHAPVIADFGA